MLKRRRRCGLIGVPISLRSGVVANLRDVHVIYVVRAQCGIETIESEACVCLCSSSPCTVPWRAEHPT